MLSESIMGGGCLVKTGALAQAVEGRLGIRQWGHWHKNELFFSVLELVANTDVDIKIELARTSVKEEPAEPVGVSSQGRC